ncbi:hypothetical protein BDV39DRAFT_209116 [Aspergillus sergii]|uniref:Tat pathway signal sequence n=1 Tax=Aspergillus sergii TaxID=1034303 RepID=A0A5N6WQJ3_9EURO|nr:hypothetical protein BDV39DRAFT_209116 [Aspergillus sergii]
MDHHQEQHHKLLDEGLSYPSPPNTKWKYAAISIATIALFQSIALITFILPAPSYATGFATDFPLARSHIALEQKRFTSPIRATPNGTLYRIDDPTEPAYVGNYPTEQLDAAWEALIGDRYFPLTEQEISHLSADTDLPALEPVPDRNGTHWAIGGVDVLHSLHCLDTLRRHMHGQNDDMGRVLGADVAAMHIDHCINQLRQTIMCSADLTPVTLRPVQTHDPEGNPIQLLLGETERVHTCRDFGRVRDWAQSRVEEWLKGRERNTPSTLTSIA